LNHQQAAGLPLVGGGKKNLLLEILRLYGD